MLELAVALASHNDDARRSRWARGLKLACDVAAGLLVPLGILAPAARTSRAPLTPEAKRFIDFLVDDALRELGLLD